MPRNYNFIYSKLVEDEDDFVGQIAYSLYKQDKIDHIEQYFEAQGKEIGEEDLKQFHEMSCKPVLLEAYRIKAENILQDFISDTLEENIQEIEERTIKNQSEILKDIIKPITPASKTKQFWTRVLQSALSALTLSAILALLVLIIYISKVGFLKAISNIYNVEIVTDNPQKTPNPQHLNDTLKK